MVKGKPVVEYVECEVCGVYYPEDSVCPCQGKVVVEPVVDDDVQDIVDQWKGYKGFVKPSVVPDVDVDKDVLKDVVYPQIQTIQGKGVVKYVYQEGKCSECGKDLHDWDTRIVHTKYWEGRNKYQHNGWDDIEVVCKHCQQKIVRTRPQG